MFATSESSSDSPSPSICQTETESAGSPMTPQPLDSASIDCIFCLSRLPHDCVPPVGEYEPVARITPCCHFMHNECLKSWIERANTCPICRISFNEVSVLPYVTGTVLETYEVEDKIQRVADEGADVPPDAQVPVAAASIPGAPLADRLRQHRAWELAWEHLDADLQIRWYGLEDEHDPRDNNRRWRNRWNQRMDRRRVVAAAQTGPGPNAFAEQPMAWTIQTARPRTVFPHIPQVMTKEEQNSWKMMEIAENLEKSDGKRRRNSESEELLLERMGVRISPEPVRDERKFKRPRTKRDSQIRPIQTLSNNGESSSTAAPVPSPTIQPPTEGDAASPGGLFTSILQGIGKSKDIPIVSAADIYGRDLGRMRPISPDRSSATSGTSRSRSPPTTFSPSSPPTSRPSSPDGVRGRVPLLPASPAGLRTPARSPERRKPWEVGAPAVPASQPTSPPGSRVQSPQTESETVAVTAKEKADIMELVAAALKPHYKSQKLSKQNYTDINRKVSRMMYQAVSEGCMREEWKDRVSVQVEKEMQKL